MTNSLTLLARTILRLSASVALLTALSSSAGAEDPKKKASELFTEGERRFSVGDYAGAAAAFDQANRLSPHPNVVWNVARSFERAGDAPHAANAFFAYLQSTKEGAPDRASAAQSLSRLTKVVARLELHAPERDGPPVLVDGEPVDGAVDFVSPGSHTITMSVGGRPQTQTVVVDAGATRSVSALPDSHEVPPPAPPPAASLERVAPPSPAPPSGLPPIVFWVGAGLTVVATGFAVGFGIDTLNERDRFDHAPSRATFDAGRDKQLRTNVAIVAAAGLGTLTAAAGLFLVDWHGRGASTYVTAGPGAVGFGARFW